MLLLLDDGGVEFGDCAAVQYSGAGGRDPLFAARDAAAAVERGRRARACGAPTWPTGSAPCPPGSTR